MANYILQELPEEMTDGKKVIFPKMQTYTMHDCDEVIKNMRIYSGSILCRPCAFVPLRHIPSVLQTILQ